MPFFKCWLIKIRFYTDISKFWFSFSRRVPWRSTTYLSLVVLPQNEWTRKHQSLLYSFPRPWMCFLYNRYLALVSAFSLSNIKKRNAKMNEYPNSNHQFYNMTLRYRVGGTHTSLKRNMVYRLLYPCFHCIGRFSVRFWNATSMLCQKLFSKHVQTWHLISFPACLIVVVVSGRVFVLYRSALVEVESKGHWSDCAIVANACMLQHTFG